MNFHDVMSMVKERAGMQGKPKNPEVVDAQHEAMKQAWVDMMSKPAWKDLLKIFDEVRNLPLELLDEKAVGDVNLVDAGFIKGVRSAIKTISQKIEGRLK